MSKVSSVRFFSYFESPVGPLRLVSDGEALTGLYMNEHLYGPKFTADWREERVPVIVEAASQLKEYFAGTHRVFELPLAPAGTTFQQQVWKALLELGFGETTTYGEIARRIGNPSATRAVGAANGQNPISIIIPCHRLVGSDGKLIRYGGGLERKQFLLDHERK